MLTKKEIIDLIKLLSALESWGFSACKNSGGSPIPDYLLARLDSAVDVLEKELLGVAR